MGPHNGLIDQGMNETPEVMQLLNASLSFVLCDIFPLAVQGDTRLVAYSFRHLNFAGTGFLISRKNNYSETNCLIFFL